jgi:hypothetical protein
VTGMKTLSYAPKSSGQNLLLVTSGTEIDQMKIRQ